MDMLTKVKRKFILFLTLLMLVLGWGGAELFQLFFAEYYSPYYPLIPVFFYVFGFIFIYLFEYMHKHMHGKSLMVYVIDKGAKLLVGLIFLVLYAMLIGFQTKAYLWTFLIYYVIYMIFESCFFLRFEMEMKNKKK